MHKRPLLIVLAAVFAGLATVLTIGAAVAETPVPLFGAVPLAVTAGLMWYQGTGRLAARVLGAGGRRRRRRTTVGGPAGAGPRGDPRDADRWEDPFWQEARREARTRARRQRNRRERRAGGRREVGGRQGPGGRTRGRGGDRRGTGPASAAEAYRTLGLEPGASQSAVREAYREKVKRHHPDAEDGDVETFKEVTAAYERLTE